MAYPHTPTTLSMRPLMLLFFGAMLHCMAEGVRVNRIVFGATSRFIYTPPETNANELVNWFACSGSGCVELPPTDSVVHLHMQSNGDFLRIVDERFRTQQWVVWGDTSRMSLADDIVRDITHTWNCTDVWNSAKLTGSRGIERSSVDGIWRHTDPLTTKNCLSGGDAVVQDSLATSHTNDDAVVVDFDAIESVVYPFNGAAATTAWSALHLTIDSNDMRTNRSLVFTRWIANGISCAVPSTPSWASKDEDAPPSLPTTWLTDDDRLRAHAFWNYAWVHERTDCANSSAFQLQVESILECLSLGAIQPHAIRGWNVPFDYDDDDVVPSGRETERTLRAQRLRDLELRWYRAYDFVPLFLCVADTDTTTRLHSIVVVFMAPALGRPFHTRSYSHSIASDILDTLPLSSPRLALCPSYFLM